MNGTEFNEWSENYFACFPRVGKFIDDLGRNDDGAAVVRVLGVWQRELATVELIDAHEVTRRMLHRVEGFQPPADFKEHEIPVFVAKCCDRVRFEKIQNSMPREPERLPNPMAAVKLTAICEEAKRRALAGENPYAISVELCPVDPNDMRNYRCLLCCDRGLVQCWTAHSMRLAALGKLTLNGGIYSTMVRCSCYAGNQYEEYSYKDSTKKNGRRETPVIYNDHQWVTFEHIDENGDRHRGNSQASIDRLNLFMARYVPNHGVQEFAY